MDLIRENENDFSFWFPKIKNCGIPVPKTFYAKLPDVNEEPEYACRLYEAFYMEHPKEDEEVVRAWLDELPRTRLHEWLRVGMRRTLRRTHDHADGQGEAGKHDAQRNARSGDHRRALRLLHCPRRDF